jgi:hypothetical protein
MNSLVQELRAITLPALPPNARRWLVGARQWAQRRRRTIAVAGSGLLHILFILALLPQAPEGLSGGGSNGTGVGAGAGETYAAVDLYTVRPAHAATAALKPPDDTKADRLDTPADPPKPEAVIAAADVAQLAPAEPVLPSVAAAGGPGPSGTAAGAGDDLWGAIAPCWKRVAGADTLPVTLKVTFAAGGGLSKPPQIVRADGAAITPQSLHSEAEALAALSQCGAYPMAAGRQDVEVHFPKPE